MSYSDKNVICPFYCVIHGAQYHNEAVLIKCEAPIGIRSLFITLSTPEKKNEHLNKYCCTFGYNLCPIAQMLLSTKYGEGAD